MSLHPMFSGTRKWQVVCSWLSAKGVVATWNHLWQDRHDRARGLRCAIGPWERTLWSRRLLHGSVLQERQWPKMGAWEMLVMMHYGCEVNWWMIFVLQMMVSDFLSGATDLGIFRGSYRWWDSEHFFERETPGKEMVKLDSSVYDSTRRIFVVQNNNFMWCHVMQSNRGIEREHNLT